jgi:hypothetical protein
MLWIAGGVIAAAVLFALYVQTQVRAGLREASARAAAAEQGAADTRDRAAREIAAAQQVANARLQEAQQAARSAQMLSLIASASDLRRFDLKGQDGQTAQVLWSRTQGVAVNARDLATPPSGQTYQVWLITPGQAVSAGVLPVESSGRASAVFEPPAELPRPVVRATITLEPTGGSPAPTGEALLAVAAPAIPAAP